MQFYKYQGTGNDFVIIDNRENNIHLSKEQVANICHRRFGIGADGLILLENDVQTDFKMVYYNSDGNESTMCGNGGRCIVAFAKFLNIFENHCTFIAIDGLHEASVNNSIVKLKMIDVDMIEKFNDDFILNTGSPHFVQYVNNIEDFDVYAEGKKIRNSNTFLKEGINVNFVEKITDNQLFVRTYERGVEDETYSCGTGVTASALTFFNNSNLNEVDVKTLGGNLKVYATKTDNNFREIWLEGPALQIYQGQINL